jgi:hypothetical protein
MPIPEKDRQRIRDTIAQMVYDALGADEVRIAATDGFTESDFDEGPNNGMPIYRTRVEAEYEHRLEIYWRK